MKIIYGIGLIVSIIGAGSSVSSENPYLLAFNIFIGIINLVFLIVD